MSPDRFIGALVSSPGHTDLALGGAILFALLIGHALADYPLQGAFLAKAKDRHSDSGAMFAESVAPKGLWIHALTAHSLVHAGAVWLVTGSVLLALVELVLHWIIDFAKCEGWTGFTADQLLHVLCKIGYATVIATGYVAAKGIICCP
ncbi:DUF3307 domain-containing protein [Luteolibacter sp. LG18]|uniref:DUF3307 domain-containing protein n=1 Tax=Luteolibacter sp. LG18 TaxID=2819286 RepID=UPI002B320598|nr:hypothetical protein llg_01380 [Luteolibacter sp. LG18]